MRRRGWKPRLKPGEPNAVFTKKQFMDIRTKIPPLALPPENAQPDKGAGQPGKNTHQAKTKGQQGKGSSWRKDTEWEWKQAEQSANWWDSGNRWGTHSGKGFSNYGKG